MDKFTIHVMGRVSPTTVYMEPGPRVIDIARALSSSFSARVTVEMYARVRYVFENGLMVDSNQDLTEFFEEASDQEKWNWSGLGKFKL